MCLKMTMQMPFVVKHHGFGIVRGELENMGGVICLGLTESGSVGFASHPQTAQYPLLVLCALLQVNNSIY